MARKNIYKINLWDSVSFHTHYDQCTFPECGYEFQEADWTYFGKDIDGNWQHVCEIHKDSFQWAALQIFGQMPKDVYRIEPYTVPSYLSPPQPDIDLWLWRYMSFDRFEEFIETKSIFFPKAKTFLKDDPLECTVSIKGNIDWLSNLRTIAYPTFYETELASLSEQEKEQKIETRKQEVGKHNTVVKKTTDRQVVKFHLTAFPGAGEVASGQAAP